MLHTKFKFVIIALACALVSSCGSSDSFEDSVNYLAVQIRDGRNWSIVDSKGKIVVDEEFKHEPSIVMDDIFWVEEGSSYTLYNINDLKHPLAERLYEAGYFNEGVIPVTPKGGHIKLLNKKGKEVAVLKKIKRCAAFVQDGMLPVMNDDYLWGYANKKGEVVIKPKYSTACHFSEGLAVVGLDDDSRCVINKEGKVVFKIKDKYSLVLEIFKDGMLAVKDTEKDNYGFLNKKGEFTKLSGNYIDIEIIDSKYFAFKTDDYVWGVKSLDGETLFKAKYEDIVMLNDGDFFVGKEKNDRTEYCVINKKGEKSVEFDDYVSVLPIDNGHFHFIGRTRSKYVLLDKKGKQIGDEDFADISLNYSPQRAIDSDYSDYSYSEPEATEEEVYCVEVETVEPEEEAEYIDTVADDEAHPGLLNYIMAYAPRSLYGNNPAYYYKGYFTDGKSEYPVEFVFINNNDTWSVVYNNLYTSNTKLNMDITYLDAYNMTLENRKSNFTVALNKDTDGELTGTAVQGSSSLRVRLLPKAL